VAGRIWWNAAMDRLWMEKEWRVAKMAKILGVSPLGRRVYRYDKDKKGGRNKAGICLEINRVISSPFYQGFTDRSSQPKHRRDVGGFPRA
jgi:hypothetical protein